MSHQISGPDLTRATDMHCRGLLVFGQSTHRSGGRPHARPPVYFCPRMTPYIDLYDSVNRAPVPQFFFLRLVSYTRFTPGFEA